MGCLPAGRSGLLKNSAKCRRGWQGRYSFFGEAPRNETVQKAIEPHHEPRLARRYQRRALRNTGDDGGSHEVTHARPCF